MHPWLFNIAANNTFIQRNQSYHIEYSLDKYDNKTQSLSATCFKSGWYNVRNYIY